MEEKQENVVEETTQQENPVKEEPKVDGTVEKIKVKKKPTMKKLSQDDEVIKVDLSKPVEDTKEDEQPVDNKQTEDVQEEIVEETTDKKEVVDESTKEDTETPVIEEVTDEKVEETVEKLEEQVEEAVAEAEATGKPIPENIQKLMDFMEETGGDLNDYVKLNQDYSELDNQDLLQEYYKQTKPHLNNEEINFLMEDQFSYDEDTDDERSIKRKKLAQKEQVASAKSHLDGLKSKYYEDIKNGSKLTSEQQEAIDFFNRYNKEEAENKQGTEDRISIFKEKTNNVFNDKFKGFEYNVGEKKFRYNVQDAKKVGENQSDISNFIGKFLDENNTMKDAEGYHKSIFTANNADAIARHFYEQGKSDAIKQSVEKGKNISMEPRQAHGEVQAGGIKVRALGDNTADFKFKIKNK